MPVGSPPLVEELVAVEPMTSLAGRVTDQAPARAVESAVHLEAVRKVFGETEAVAGIDLDIADGEFFSMLGPSGSGKTTTLRMIAGFEQPTSGRILLHGSDVRVVFGRIFNHRPLRLALGGCARLSLSWLRRVLCHRDDRYPKHNRKQNLFHQ